MIAFVEVLISLSYRFLKQGCKLYVVEMLVFAGAVISVATVETARFREPEMLSAQRFETGPLLCSSDKHRDGLLTLCSADPPPT